MKTKTSKVKAGFDTLFQYNILSVKHYQIQSTNYYQ